MSKEQYLEYIERGDFDSILYEYYVMECEKKKYKTCQMAQFLQALTIYASRRGNPTDYVVQMLNKEFGTTSVEKDGVILKIY